MRTPQQALQLKTQSSSKVFQLTNKRRTLLLLLLLLPLQLSRPQLLQLLLLPFKANTVG